MSFSTDIAGLVADQLSRFVTLNSHQLAGQVENLDFWLAQVRHALTTIDGYGVRFVRLQAAQERYTITHNVTEWIPGDPSSRRRKACPPLRIPDRELQKSRRALTEAASRFLERCRRDGLISELEVSTAFESLDIEQEHA